MKKVLFFLVIFGLFLAGCSTSINNSNPVNQNTKKELIPIPPKSGTSVENQFSTTKTINGSTGGVIILNKIYFNPFGKLVAVHARLLIPAGAFNGTLNITLTTDDAFAAVYFDPHMVFNIPLSLNLTYLGLDLTSLNLSSNQIDFGYIADNGNFEHVSYSSININNFKGLLSVQNAQINHFSRYGFVR